MCACVEHLGQCGDNNGGCSSYATCTNIHNGVKCTCKQGFNGNGQSCAGKN